MTDPSSLDSSAQERTSSFASDPTFNLWYLTILNQPTLSRRRISTRQTHRSICTDLGGNTDTLVEPSIRIDSPKSMNTNQSIFGEHEEQHVTAPSPSNFQGDQQNPLPADIEAIIQQLLRQERMAWEAEREEQDQARSSRVGNPPIYTQSYYTDNIEHYKDMEERTEERDLTLLTLVPPQRASAHIVAVHNDPIVVAMQQ
ncbi:hypothetical protein LIER_35865 [Lithospermum erythrorhizon]|uniref:Uncharacterized protein n=1 Tax=Lithospermum erythrorhizon TaxID=34254 RepID=A0AAV3P235_LITER